MVQEDIRYGNYTCIRLPCLALLIRLFWFLPQQYTDFVYIGTPMQIFLWILSILFLSTSGTIPWWVSWIGTLVFLLLTAFFRISGFSNFRGIAGKKDATIASH